MQIININDQKYQVLAVRIAAKEPDTKLLKKQWNADTILKNGANYFICRNIIDADFTDIIKNEKALGEKN